VNALVGATEGTVYALNVQSGTATSALVRVSRQGAIPLATTITASCQQAAVSADRLFYLDAAGLHTMRDGVPSPTVLTAPPPAAFLGMVADGDALYYANGPAGQEQILVWEWRIGRGPLQLAALAGHTASALALDARWVYLAVEGQAGSTLWRVPRDPSAGAPRSLAQGVGTQLVRIQALGSTLYWSYYFGSESYITGGVLQLLALPGD
jgi:hypothetical protein